MCGVNTTNPSWFASYLNVRKQYIKITESVDTLKKRYQVWNATGLSARTVIVFVKYKQSP